MSYIYRPILQGMVSIEAVNQGKVSLADIIRLNGLLDMQNDIERYHHQRNHNK